MDTKNLLSAVVGGVLALVLGFVFFGVGQDGMPGIPGKNGVDGVGSVVGPDVYNHMNFADGYTKGGRVVSTSTSNTAETLLASDLVTNRGNYVTRLEVTPNQGNLTLTLPATSTLTNFVPNNGDTYTFVIENEASAATTTTIAAGAGMDLQEPDGQNVVIGQNNYALVTVMRDEDRDMIVWIDETIPAD